MNTLESDLENLKSFDEVRMLAVRMRNDGLKELSLSLDPKAKQPKWSKVTGTLEQAEVLKALLEQRPPDKAIQKDIEKLAKELESVTIGQVMHADPDNVHVLRAAKAMCALAGAPDYAFSESAMYYLYCIVREIHVADEPDWAVGSARGGGGGDGDGDGGGGGVPSSYVTWQCVRAIIDFQDALRQTGKLLREVATLLELDPGYKAAFAHKPSAAVHPSQQNRIDRLWRHEDAERLSRSFIITVSALRDNIAVKLPGLTRLERTHGREGVRAFLTTLHAELLQQVQLNEQAFARAVGKIVEYRKTEYLRKSSKSTRIRKFRTETAHLLALETVRRARAFAADALKSLRGGKDPETMLYEVAKKFEKAADKFSTLLEPIEGHVSSALDRELAAASSQTSIPGWDPAETVFAAAAYGDVTKSWNDGRVLRAVDHVLRVIGEQGQFPLGRPIRTSAEGYQLHAANAESLRALARVLHFVGDADLTPAAVRRMLSFFQAMQTRSARGVFNGGIRTPQNRRLTASAILALTAMKRMLDDRINATVYRYFSVEKFNTRNTRLRELFYADYGLRGAPRRPAPGENGGGSLEKQSIAVVLQRMRAHVRGVHPGDEDSLFSLVLHGPPGTGKTTLVEALATSAEVALVQVTPSDVVIGGADQIERRARDVFQALALLTNTVILFDEFDPVLLRRNPEETNPTVFSFLTPGMLPKLKNLYEKAKEGGVAYVLITNLIGKLDDAAIRNGRFDERIGIYPPDLLSRYGRLRRAVEQFERSAKDEKPPRRPDHEQRVWDVVRATAGGSMTTLGKPGWFSPPGTFKSNAPNAFGYIYGTGNTPPDVPREVSLENIVLSESGTAANRDAEPTGAARHAASEYKEFAWVTYWDRTVARKDCPVPTDLPEPPEPVEIDEIYQRARASAYGSITRDPASSPVADAQVPGDAAAHRVAAASAPPDVA